MNELNNMLFKLLRSVLCDEKLDLSVFEGIDEEKLEMLYKISKKHDLAHLVGAALDKTGSLSDTSVAKKLAKQQMLAIYRYENMKYELDRISSVLEKEKIVYIPLKGAVIRRLYPEPWMRTSCDVDVLVHEDELDRAVRALIDTLDYRVETERGYHDVSLFSESGVHLELHFNVKENVSLLDGVLERAWSYRRSETSEGYGRLLSKEFFVYHTLAHAAYHFVNGGCGIRPFIDLWFINKTWEYDRDEVLKLCEESGIADFWTAAEELSRSWMEGDAYSDLTKRMEKYILFGGVFGTEEALIAVKQSARGGKMGYAVSRIFAPYDQLKAKYPSLKSRALVPLYQVRRWADGVREKKLSRSVKNLKRSARLDNKKAYEIGSLLDDLKLNKHVK